MSNISKLYKKSNKRIKKSVNIEDTLYEKLKYLMENVYDTTVSDVINICIEDYRDLNNPKYYEKPKNETVTYRSIMIRKENLEWLQSVHRKTGISVTRLLNAAIKECLDNIKDSIKE